MGGKREYISKVVRVNEQWDAVVFSWVYKLYNTNKWAVLVERKRKRKNSPSQLVILHVS